MDILTIAQHSTERKSSFGLGQVLHDDQHLPQRTREPVEFPDHQHVTLAQLIQQPVQFGAVPTSARCLLAKDALAPRCFERGYLRRGVLIVGRDPGIADQYCAKVSPMISIKQQLFAMR